MYTEKQIIEAAKKVFNENRELMKKQSGNLNPQAHTLAMIGLISEQLALNKLLIELNILEVIN